MNKRGTILVVDDTPETLRVLTGMLQQEGYSVRPANSGELALASIAAQPPDLVLLDIRMPGLDGFEVCRRLKGDEATRDIPVIFQSVATDLADRLEGLRLGAVDYISKPFQREELLARIQVQLRLRELTERLEQKVGERTEELSRANRALETEAAELRRVEEERLIHLNFLESLDRVNLVIQGAHTLEQMMSDVLDQVLAIFDCDRAYLIYPCDPEAASWSVPMERTKPEYPGANVKGLELPMDPESQRVFRTVRNTDSVVSFGPGSDYPLPEWLTEQFGVQSQLAMVSNPKQGKPWMSGMHQCSHARVWTQEEQRLFQEINRRLADGLSSLLMYRELQESEERFRMVFENSPVSIWEEDFSGVKALFDDLRRQGVADIEAYFDNHPDTVERCAQLARINNVNRAALTLHEAESKEELFAGLVNTFTPDSFAAFRQELVCLWHGGREMIRDAEVRTLSGEPRQVTVHFSLCPGYEENFAKVIVSLVDISERKEAEKALHLQTAELEAEVTERQMAQESLQEKALLLEEEIELRQKAQEELEQLTIDLRRREKEFRTLAENSPDTIIRYNCDCQRMYVNPSFERATGIPLSAALGPPAPDTWLGSMPLTEYQQRLKQVIATGSPAEVFLDWAGRNGNAAHHSVRIVPEYDHHGTVTGALVIGRDITALKRTQGELEKLNKELEQRVKLRTAELEEKNAELARMNRLFVGRELKMVELKERIQVLESGQ